MSTIFEEDIVCPYCGNEVCEFYEIEGWNSELQNDGDEQILICEKCGKKYRAVTLRPFCFVTERLEESNEQQG